MSKTRSRPVTASRRQADAVKAAHTMAYHVYKDSSSLWRWRLRATNGRIIADSGESYVRVADCLAAISLVKGSAAAPVLKP